MPAPQPLGSHIGPAPFSSDEAARLERESCDYSIKISLDEAQIGKGRYQILLYVAF